VTVKEYYNLQFATDLGKTRGIRITGAKTGINPGAANVQLTRIISSGALNGPNGIVTSFRKGDLVTDTVEKII